MNVGEGGCSGVGWPGFVPFKDGSVDLANRANNLAFGVFARFLGAGLAVETL